MIFYNHQLMPDENQIRLFSVSTKSQVTDYDQHLIQIKDRLEQMVMDSYQEQEDPLHLLEDYLVIDYNQCCESADQMTEFIFSHNAMTSAKNLLFENWQQYDQSFVAIPSKITTNEALNIHLETDLRSFLEALTNVHGI